MIISNRRLKEIISQLYGGDKVVMHADGSVTVRKAPKLLKFTRSEVEVVREVYAKKVLDIKP